jgi:hypothetical protein
MGFAYAMMRSEHCAFNKVEMRFCRESAKTDIFVIGMIDRSVTSELAPDWLVRNQFIGHKVRFAINRSHNCIARRLGFYVRDMERVGRCGQQVLSWTRRPGELMGGEESSRMCASPITLGDTRSSKLVERYCGDAVPNFRDTRLLRNQRATDCEQAAQIAIPLFADTA